MKSDHDNDESFCGEKPVLGKPEELMLVSIEIDSKNNCQQILR